MIGRESAEKAYWACYDSIDTLGKVAKKVKSDCGFRKKQSLYFAALKKDVDALKRNSKLENRLSFR